MDQNEHATVWKQFFVGGGGYKDVALGIWRGEGGGQTENILEELFYIILLLSKLKTNF